MRIIGTTYYPHIPKACRKKLNRKAIKGILIGDDSDKGYHIYGAIKVAN